MNSIKEKLEKIKIWWQTEENVKSKILTFLLVFLTGTASFGLGKLSAFESKKEPVKIQMNELLKTPTESISLKAGGLVVASKEGTKYHYPWCAGAKRILEKNKVYFDSIEEAKAAGLQPAGNCKGLK